MAYNDPRLNQPFVWDKPGELFQQSVRGARPVHPAATTPTPAQPVVTPQPPALPRPNPRLGVGGLDSNPTNIAGIRKVTNLSDPSAAPLFTNIAGIAGTQGMFDAPQISQASLDRTMATSPLFTGQVASADGISTIDPVSAGLARKYVAADEAAAREAADLAGTRRDLSLGIRESLARGVSPQALQAATQGLASLQPAPTAGPDLGDYASLLNAQTAQDQLGLGEARLAQEKTIADNRTQADSEKAVLKLASDAAMDQFGVVDPTKFAVALGQFGTLFGLNPTKGVGDEDIANQLRSKGYTEADIQQYQKQKSGK